MPEYDAVICGAGVAGLALAVALGRQRRRVLLIEKQRIDLPIHRGEVLQPRTLAILEELDVLRDLRARGALVAHVFESRKADGTLIGFLDYRCLPTPYNYVLAHYYHEIKAALLDQAHRLADIRQEAQVRGLLRAPDERIVGVQLSSGEEISARLVVGADGRRSPVRGLAALPVRMEQYDHQLIAFDLLDLPDLEQRITAFFSKDGLRLLYPMPGGRARLYIQIELGQFRSIGRQGLRAWLEEVVAAAPGLGGVATQIAASCASYQTFGAWRFCAPQWTMPGLALIGDAAHSVHPMAAQGMNMAIADAWALAQALAEGDAWLGPAPLDQALGHYERIRRPQVEYIGRLSHQMSLLCTATSRFRRWLARHIVGSNRSNERLRYLLTYNMSGLGIQRFSLIDRLHQFGLLHARSHSLEGGL